ncbi:MAG: flagellar motor protein MotB [Flavobacteriales bacterium]|nr:MAG: flagellar motor protein MotB [Flavobacteriales bacterium]
MRNIITLSFLFIAFLLSAQSTPGKHSIRLLKVNTKNSDFGVNFYGKDRVVFASPTEKVSIVRRTWDGNDQPFLDLFVGDIDSTGQIINKTTLRGDVNKKFHEASVTFTKDLKTVYFTANNYNEKGKPIKGANGFDNIQLYKADVASENIWNNIVKLPFNSDDFSTGSPTLDKDEKKLYFVSDRPGSIGKTDIWVVDILPNNEYSEPVNLGPKINTEEREMFPHIDEDNMLIFSSNGHPGFGNLDLFAAMIYDNSVSEPINLGEPLNSPRDDFAYILRDRVVGYFSSNRKEGKGDDDIYSFRVDEPIFIECLQTITGVVKDKDSGELLPGALVSILDSDGNQLQMTAALEETAVYSFDVPCNGDYTLVATHENYLKLEVPVSTVNDTDAPPVTQDLEMELEFKPVGNEVLVNINVIYFDFDKWNIRPDAAEELDKVVEVMNKYPKMKIHATSHTDSRGTKRYNQKLSERRAKSTVDYIVSKGISADRITSEGKGESELVNKCSDGVPCSRKQHQLNRRTNFTVQERTIDQTGGDEKNETENL